MKKNILYIIIILIIIISFVLFYDYKTGNKVINSDTNTNSGYANSNLGISFSPGIPLFERNSNGFVKISNFNDPHFYSNLQCSEMYDRDSCYGIEIQKIILEGRNKKDVIVQALKDGIKINIINNEFDFYKSEDANSPGWPILYFAVSKTEDIYYNILTNSTTTRLVESSILPTFKSAK